MINKENAIRILLVRGNAVWAGMHGALDEWGEKCKKEKRGRVKGAHGAGGLGVVASLDRRGECGVSEVKGEGGRVRGLGMVRKESGRGSLGSLGLTEEEGGGWNRVLKAYVD
ncbi:hypothetical protein GOBAR_AA05064 [Gossypium barbadense]|uniref:Uncharacterized protein n=1 Tax=Gossypium barbadense TaxID=3634 RepID=A0A2P5YIV8_GOSBA|nr:hypothetical protein GOBAR_AA05064 [Gossypium barbadense]